MYKKLEKIAIVCTIYLMISFFWIVVENVVLGYTNPNTVDTVITVFFTASVYGNYKAWKSKSGRKVEEP